MIKKTDIKNLSEPKIKKAKQDYGNKGSVSCITEEGTYSPDTNPKPGMGKGKARGMGAAEFGGKFSGIY